MHFPSPWKGYTSGRDDTLGPFYPEISDAYSCVALFGGLAGSKEKKMGTVGLDQALSRREVISLGLCEIIKPHQVPFVIFHDTLLRSYFS